MHVNAAGTSLMEDTVRRLTGRTNALVLSGQALAADIGFIHLMAGREAGGAPALRSAILARKRLNSR